MGICVEKLNLLYKGSIILLFSSFRKDYPDQSHNRTIEGLAWLPSQKVSFGGPFNAMEACFSHFRMFLQIHYFELELKKMDRITKILFFVCVRGLLHTKHVLIEKIRALFVEVFKVPKELFVSHHFKMSFNEKEQKFERSCSCKNCQIQWEDLPFEHEKM